MPKSTDCCNRILNLMYRATAWPTVADNAAATPLTNVYVALHDTGPLTPATNSQAEYEVSYTNYVRKAVARSTGWVAASGGVTSNAALLQFDQSGALGDTLHTVSTGTTVSGATPVWHSGPLSSPITIGASASITPQFLANALQITET